MAQKVSSAGPRLTLLCKDVLTLKTVRLFRAMNSAGGALVGSLILVGALAIFAWNEAQSVENRKALTECGQTLVDVVRLCSTTHLTSHLSLQLASLFCVQEGPFAQNGEACSSVLCPLVPLSVGELVFCGTLLFFESKSARAVACIAVLQPDPAILG